MNDNTKNEINKHIKKDRFNKNKYGSKLVMNEWMKWINKILTNSKNEINTDTKKDS